MKMSERIMAASTGPTAEQIKEWHDSLDCLEKIAAPHNRATPLFVSRLRKALPPLPEPERPRIKPASELVVNILHETQGGGLTTPAADLEWGIKVARTEMATLLQWHIDKCQVALCERCDAFSNLLTEIREADKL